MLSYWRRDSRRKLLKYRESPVSSIQCQTGLCIVFLEIKFTEKKKLAEKSKFLIAVKSDMSKDGKPTVFRS